LYQLKGRRQETERVKGGLKQKKEVYLQRKKPAAGERTCTEAFVPAERAMAWKKVKGRRAGWEGRMQKEVAL
jgi:hypothetical protein